MKVSRSLFGGFLPFLYWLLYFLSSFDLRFTASEYLFDILKRFLKLDLPEHLSSPPVFSGVRFTRSLVLYVCFVNRCLSFCTFSFGHCVVCSSSIYGFWLPLWYLQTLFKYKYTHKHLYFQPFLFLILILILFIFLPNLECFFFYKTGRHA